MSQSLAAIYVHAVFSTKQRSAHLANRDLRMKTHAYIAEVTKRLDCPALEVGGTEDHVHALIRLGKSVSISEWIRETKRLSSSQVKLDVPTFAWQSGYGAFSVPSDRLDTLVAYIRSQEDHHRKVSFQDEFRALLAEHGIACDERYVWD
jgi:putative transposase